MFNVYVLPTCHVYFAHGVNCGYGTVPIRQLLAQSAGAVEYTDRISADGLDSNNESPKYDTKQ